MQRFFIFFGLVVVFCLTVSSAVANPAPNQVAKAMVKALKETPGGIGQLPALAMYGDLQGEEKEAFQAAEKEAFDIATKTTGEQLGGMQKMQVGTDIIGWFLARRPMTREKAAMYVARYKAVDLPTVMRWREAQAKSTRVGNSPTLTLSAIVFQDFLWSGATWKAGNPDRAINRLSSLSSDAASRWDAVAKKNGSDVYGAWTLLAVDGLFVGDAFQQSVFDAAFPIAQKLLAAH